MAIHVVQVPLNPAFNVVQVISALNHLAASHLMIGAVTRVPRKKAQSNIGLLKELLLDTDSSNPSSEKVPSLSQIVLVDNTDENIDSSDLKSVVQYRDVLGDSVRATGLPDQGLHPDDIVNIQFTSGTTSAPKAACLTHRSILNNGKSIGDRMQLTPEDIICCPPPLFQ
jgi:TBC1 domain family member 8/9